MIVARTYENVREDVLAYLKEIKATAPDFSVIDVGGAAGSWCDEFVDAYIDIREFDTNKELHIGDICLEETWQKVGEKRFDFAICTHVLEDIRDPVTAINGLQRIAKTGFVATPTKWDEFSNIEDSLWLGNYHHRWVYDFDENGGITILPKSVATNRFMLRNRILYALDPATIARRFLTATHLRKSGRLLGPDISRKSWKAPYPSHELSFVWRDRIPYEFQDWFPNPRALLDRYGELFRREVGVDGPFDLTALLA